MASVHALPLPPRNSCEERLARAQCCQLESARRSSLLATRLGASALRLNCACCMDGTSALSAWKIT